MDRRIVFLVVFVITLISTMLVFGVCVLTHQPLWSAALYSVMTMWIMGIVSQLLLQNLYQAIVGPLEQERNQQCQEEVVEEVNLEDVEEIDEATRILQEREQDVGLQGSSVQDFAPPTVGVHIEQKG